MSLLKNSISPIKKAINVPPLSIAPIPPTNGEINLLLSAPKRPPIDFPKKLLGPRNLASCFPVAFSASFPCS